MAYKNKKFTPCTCAMLLKEQGFKYISGRWYRKDKEITTYIDNYLLKITDLFPNIRKIKETKKFFIQCYGTDEE